MKMEFVVICPHCQDKILIAEINCSIFRHGVYKANNEQINPHSTKQTCDMLYQNNLIYGCGKPFRIIKDTSENYQVEICDYI